MKRRSIGPQRLRKKLVGTWRLIRYEIIGPGTRRSYPLGTDAAGILAYDMQGNMSGQLMSRHRPRYVSGDMRRGTPHEIAAAAKGYLSYFGTYTLDADEGTVTHFVEGSLFPNWVGTEQKRFFKFTRNGLILSAPFMLDGRKRTAILTWTRAR